MGHVAPMSSHFSMRVVTMPWFSTFLFFKFGLCRSHVYLTDKGWPPNLFKMRIPPPQTVSSLRESMGQTKNQVPGTAGNLIFTRWTQWHVLFMWMHCFLAMVVRKVRVMSVTPWGIHLFTPWHQLIVPTLVFPLPSFPYILLKSSCTMKFVRTCQNFLEKGRL